MLDALVWGAAAGLLARLLLPKDSAGLAITLLCGLCGCVIAFAIGHELLGLHELHLFKPESLIPAILASAALLVVLRRARAATRRPTLFS